MKLSIKTPCHENWSNMQAHSHGKFCLNCNKAVIDFTSMSDAELIKTLQSSGTGICGRLHTHQINRTLVLNTVPKQPTRFKKILAAMLLFIGAEHVSAQKGMVVGVPQTNKTQKDSMDTEKQHEGSLLAQLKGRVIDATTQEPIPFCMIYLKDSHNSTTSNKDGYFVFDIPKTQDRAKYSFQFNYIGYETFLTSIKRSELHVDITVVLKPEEYSVLMGDIYIEEPVKKKEQPKKK